MTGRGSAANLRRWIVPPALAAIALLVLAAPALADTRVSFDPQTGELQITAGSAGSNLEIREQADSIVVSDSKRPVSGIPPCRNEGRFRVRCPRGQVKVVTIEGSNAADSVRVAVSVPFNANLRGGDDSLVVPQPKSAQDSEVKAGAGDDRVKMGAGDDEVSGGRGNDRLGGQNGNDQLNGDRGRDNLNGGKGTDGCNGGPGKDKESGCEGKNRPKTAEPVPLPSPLCTMQAVGGQVAGMEAADISATCTGKIATFTVSAPPGEEIAGFDAPHAKNCVAIDDAGGSHAPNAEGIISLPPGRKWVAIRCDGKDERLQIKVALKSGSVRGAAKVFQLATSLADGRKADSGLTVS